MAFKEKNKQSMERNGDIIAGKGNNIFEQILPSLPKEQQVNKIRVMRYMGDEMVEVML